MVDSSPDSEPKSNHFLVNGDSANADMADDAEIRRRNLKLLGMGPAELARRIENGKGYVSELLSGKKSFGEKKAREIEEKMGWPRGWLDTPRLAHELDANATPSAAVKNSQAQPLIVTNVTIPPTTTWEELMSADALPETFVIEMPDDALRGVVDRGTLMIFKTSLSPGPEKIVVCEDGEGNRYVRRYALVRGARWQAQTTNPSYLPLDSDADSLKVLATAWMRAL